MFDIFYGWFVVSCYNKKLGVKVSLSFSRQKKEVKLYISPESVQNIYEPQKFEIIIIFFCLIILKENKDETHFWKAKNMQQNIVICI